MDRRKFISRTAKLSLPLSALPISGCLNGEEPPSTENETSNGVISDSLHPVTENLEEQLHQGKGNTGKTIVSIEDPSCPYCRAFHQRTFPRLQPHIEEGNLDFYYRNVPIIQPWAETACHYIEGVLKEGGQAEAWALIHNLYYSDAQDSFTKENIEEVTLEYLRNRTDIDTETLNQRVKNLRYGKFVDEDINAAKAEQVQSTPIFFLFKNGRYIGRVRGAQNYSVFQQSLNL